MSHTTQHLLQCLLITATAQTVKVDTRFVIVAFIIQPSRMQNVYQYFSHWHTRLPCLLSHSLSYVAVWHLSQEGTHSTLLKHASWEGDRKGLNKNSKAWIERREGMFISMPALQVWKSPPCPMSPKLIIWCWHAEITYYIIPEKAA